MCPAVSKRLRGGRLIGAFLVAAVALLVVSGVARAQPSFGIAGFSMRADELAEAGGSVFTQAGGHPFALSTSIEFANEPAGSYRAPVGGEARDVTIELPPGLIANPRAVAACQQNQHECSPDSQVGEFAIRAGSMAIRAPIYNLAPFGAQPADFGLQTPFGLIPLQGRLVPTPGGYALAVDADGLVALGVVSIEITLWGVPAESAHDAQRGLSCLGTEASFETNCNGGGLTDGEEARPFLTMPSDCAAPPTAIAWSDSWQHPGDYAIAEASLASLDSCDRLPFQPSLSVRPESLDAEQPVGVDLSVGAALSEAPLGVAAPPLRSATVTLPPGMSVNPAAGAGASACAASGAEGIGLPTGTDATGQPLAPDEIGAGEVAGPGGEAVLSSGNCPEASTIGTAEAQSPMLPGTIAGRIYLAEPLCGSAGQPACGEADAADGRLFRFYVELGGRGEQHPHGFVIKLAGSIRVDPANGQLTVVLAQAPQLPLSELGLRLFGGSRALLVNPSVCGPATTSSDLQPWGSPYAPDASPSSYYEIGGCVQSQPFQPSLVSGSYDVEAGSFTPFLVELGRQQGEQQLAGLQLRAPQGLTAMLAGAALCPVASAVTGACPQAARIGASAVALGSGSEPLWLDGGVYLTGPYRGSPFGLEIVTPALVGPLDLGQIVIRARLDLDPETGALIVTSDPLPQTLLGVPLQLRELRLDLDRPGFIANPTSCAPQRVLASALAAGGVRAQLSNPFGIADCSALRFAPKLSVSTSAVAGIRDGASLDLRLSQSAGPQTGQANLARLRIALPRALPTRLLALQSACRAAVFAANPAGCPAASLVGIARASTPLISGELAGPVYLVAHGHARAPSPTVILQGQGLRLDLDGQTTIERSGRTAISFDSLPDLPLRGVELYLPRGPHSVLSAAGSLCGHTLSLPLELAAHNGLVIHRTAAVAVRGCPHPARHKKHSRNSA